MEGYDEGNVYYSYQNREGAASSGGQTRRNSELNPQEIRRRFKAFVLGFCNERFRYVYRDRLRAAVGAGIFTLEVRLADLANYDPPLVARIREAPSEALIHIERGATEAAATLQNASVEQVLNATGEGRAGDEQSGGNLRG